MNPGLTISAVVPCRNEVGRIEVCLRSLLRQKEPPGGFEVIVVDGMSDDGTRAVLERLKGEAPRLRVIDNPNRLTPFALNAGIQAARGRYVAIMGSHNRYAENYLAEAVVVIEETGAENVGGAMVCEANCLMQEAIGAAFHHPFSAGGARWHSPNYEGPADTVFGGVYRRDVFERIGLFDESLVRNQDDEWNLRLLRSGGRIWQSPRIRSWYHPRATLRQLIGQYRQYGYWKVRVIQKHRLPASARHLVPGTFVALLLASLVVAALGLGLGWLTGIASMSRFGAVAACVLLIAMAVYGLAVIVASWQTARVGGWRLLPLLPGVFAAYHLGYGFGFLEGIVDFVLLKKKPSSARRVLTR